MSGTHSTSHTQRKYVFTTYAMAAALEDTPVRYEDLAEIENDFDEVETEIIRQQVTLTAPLYDRRQKTVSQIPNFWPLVLEQAPPDIDQYIQPSDSALLLSSLKSFSVSHFAIEADEPSPHADPRSFAIKFEFAPNEYFEDEIIEKKFWHRRARDGWQGLVSEPVDIKWKKGKDLTGGMLDLACKAWRADQAQSKTRDGAVYEGLKLSTHEHKALKKKIEQTGMGGLSFFAWFGFIGRDVTEDESIEATKKENARREKWRKGEKIESPLDEAEEEVEVDLSFEIFPEGDDLAVAFKEDLWPDAIKYFTQAQEQDALSDADFESDDDDDAAPELVEAEADEEDGPPAKKIKV